MKTIRWGIIGCGNVTEVKSGPGFQKATNSELVAVMRRNGALAKDYAQRHGVPKWYDDGQTLIDDPDVDVVYIATPPDAHLAYTRMAAQAGKPVYVEKPMALNFAECQAMIDACTAANVPLWVAYYRRGMTKFNKAKELIAQDAIGDVRCVNVTFLQTVRPYDPDNLPWRVRPEISGGGLFVDLASHILDYLAYMVGPIVMAQGDASNQGSLYAAEDMVTGSWVHESGVHGTGLWCFNSYTRLDQTEIIGSRGKLTFAAFQNDEPVQLTTEEGVIEFTTPEPAHVQQQLIQSIVDELNGVGQCASTGVSAAGASWAMDQMLKGYYQK